MYIHTYIHTQACTLLNQRTHGYAVMYQYTYSHGNVHIQNRCNGRSEHSWLPSYVCTWLRTYALVCV